MSKSKSQRSSFRTAFTLVEVMIVALIISILASIALPNFVSAREKSRAEACVGNLKQLDSASQQYAMDNKMQATASLTPTQFTGLAPAYIHTFPVCPEGGTYSPGASLTASPTCSISTPTAVTTDYASGGRYYHGL